MARLLGLDMYHIFPTAQHLNSYLITIDVATWTRFTSMSSFCATVNGNEKQLVYTVQQHSDGDNADLRGQSLYRQLELKHRDKNTVAAEARPYRLVL